MEGRRIAWVGLLLATLVGCSDDESQPASPTIPDPPVIPESACPPGETPMDGETCRPAGVLPEACAQGFEPDQAGGCLAILPADPCPPGLMAIPGDVTCRDVAPCGDGTWGDIPVDGSTEFVDAAYAGGVSDGSEQQPWTSIGEAMSAAAPGAVVAIAAGSYAEDLQLTGKTVELRGRCPSMVEIVGSSSESAALVIAPGAHATVVSGLAVRGARGAVIVAGSEDVLVERCWIHDAGGHGVAALADYGPTSVVVQETLVEHTIGSGLTFWSTDAVVRETVVRDVEPPPGDSHSVRGLSIMEEAAIGYRPILTVESSVFSRNPGFGISVWGCEAIIDSTVVQDTLPFSSHSFSAYGLNVEANYDDGSRGNAIVRRSIVERNAAYGIRVRGSDVVIEDTVMRDMLPNQAELMFGRGLEVALQEVSGQRSTATVRSSLIERNVDLGILVSGSELSLLSTIVRDTVPRPLDDASGGGVVAQLDLTFGPRANLTVSGSVIERNHGQGIMVIGSDGLVEGTLMRDTFEQRSDGLFGQGLAVQHHLDRVERSWVLVRDSLVEGSTESGMILIGSDVAVESTTVRDTANRAATGSFGDGICVVAHQHAASVSLVGVTVENSARAGVSSFGAAVGLGSSRLECNLIHLNAEAHEIHSPLFDDFGANACGCGAEPTECVVLSSGLAPPEALPSPEQPPPGPS